MSENTQVKKSKLVPILLIVLIVVAVGGIVTAVLLLLNQNNGGSGEDREPVNTIGYQNEGVVALDPDELQKIMEEMVEQAAEGMMDLSYKHVAYSTDGVNFACDLGNPVSNRYDMYFQIVLNNEEQDQVLLTGLLPPGSEMETFKSEIEFEVGDYEAILIFTQVDDDHATIVGQSMVILNLIVTDFGYETLPEE